MAGVETLCARCCDERVSLLSYLLSPTIDYYGTEMTTRTEVDVESLNLTSTLSRLGAGEPKVHERGSQDQKVRRTVTRWSYANVQKGLRNVLIRWVLLCSSILCVEFIMLF